MGRTMRKARPNINAKSTDAKVLIIEITAPLIGNRGNGTPFCVKNALERHKKVIRTAGWMELNRAICDYEIPDCGGGSELSDGNDTKQSGKGVKG